MGTNIPNSYSDRLCCYFEQNGVCKYMESCKFCHNTVVNFESKDFEQIVDDKDLKVTHKEDLDLCQTDFKEENHKEQTDFKEEDHKEQTDFKDENHDDYIDNQEENLKTKKDLREKKIHNEKQKQLPKIKCRYFIIGNCKNGEMCRFAHMTYSSDSKKIEALKIKEHSANIKNDPGCTEKHSAKIKNDSANKKKVFPNKKEDSDNINNDYNNIKEGKKKNIKEGKKKNIKDGVGIISDYSDDTVKEFKIIKVETSTIVKKSNAVKKLLNCKHFMSKNGCKHGNKCLFKHYRCTSDAADEPSTSDAADEPFASDAAYELSTSDAVDVLSKLSNEIKHCSTNDANKTLNHSYTEYKKDCVNPSIRMQDRDKIVDFATDDMLLSNVTSDISNLCSINSSNGNMLMSPIDNILQVSNNNPSNPQNDNHLNLQNDDPLNPQNDISNYESLKPYDKMLKGNKLKKCRFYFSNSGCRRKDLCKFLHVDFKGRNFETLETNPIEDKLKHSENQPGNIKSFENFIDFEKLRSTELLQLEKRFKNSLKSKLESTDIYTVTIEPSDPDWPYIVKAFTLSFSFPKDYPQELFKVCLENIGGLYPDGFTEFMNEFLQEWLEKRSKDHTVTDLAFRPFIRWFDRNLETLFTSSATKVKRQQDAIRAGLTFIPHNKILGSSNIFKSVNLPYETPEKKVTDHDLISNEDITQNDFQYNDTMENQFQYNENMENQFQINYSESNSSQIKKGVEVKFPKMSIMNIGTLKLTDLALTICCDRCKLRTDVKLKDQVSFATSCSKCKTVHSVAFYSELMHQISNVAGYLHLYGCKPFDLILSDSVVTLNCFKCIRDNFLQGISYGSPRHHWCTFCHEKMGIEIPAVQFNTLQPAVASVLDTKVKPPPKLKVVRDPSIKDGAPLPENGACKHYKKSYRWFRFPCCGKVFPCDKCHVESSNDGHEMLLATKMLCGFCAKEQAFSKEKPCIRCGSNTMRSRSSHWEGGKGCRDVIKMARGDKRKTAGLGKTVPRKHDVHKSK